MTNKYMRRCSTSFSSVQFSSVAQSCPTLCNPMNCSTPGLPVHHPQSSLKLTSIKSVMPSSHHIVCHPLLLLPPIPPSISLFQTHNSKENTIYEIIQIGMENNDKKKTEKWNNIKINKIKIWLFEKINERNKVLSKMKITSITEWKRMVNQI